MSNETEALFLREGRRVLLQKVFAALGARGVAVARPEPSMDGVRDVVFAGEPALGEELRQASLRAAERVWTGQGAEEPGRRTPFPGCLSLFGVVMAAGVDAHRLETVVRAAWQELVPLAGAGSVPIDAASAVSFLDEAETGLVEWDVWTGHLRLSPHAWKLFTPSPDQAPIDPRGPILDAVYTRGIQEGRLRAIVPVEIAGEQRWFELRLGSTLVDGRIRWWRGTLHDATARRREDELVARRLSRLGLALEAAGADAFEWNAATNTIDREGAAFDLPGWIRVRAGEGGAHGPVIDESALAGFQGFIRATGDGFARTEWQLQGPDGQVRHLMTRGRTVERDPVGGAPLRWAGSTVDVTELKEVARALQESEERFRALADASPVGVFIANPPGHATYMNPAMQQMCGHPLEELIGRRWLAFVHPDDLVTFAPDSRKFRDPHAEEEYGFRVVRPDGVRQLEVRSKPFRRSATGGLERVGIVVDVTERLAAERKLQESEARFRALAEAAPVGVFLSDAQGICSYTNPRMSSIFGVEQGTLLGRGWGVGMLPEDALRLRADDMRQRWMAPESLYEYRIARADGIRHLRAHVTRWRPGEEDLRIGIVVDVTDDLRREEQLREVQKLESLGLLAGGIAHDFNNLLATVLGNATLALRQLDPGDREPREALQDLVAAARRARDLTQQLLAYAGKGRIVNANVDLAGEAREMVQLLLGPALRPFDVRVEAMEPAVVSGDRSQLQQVLMNVLTNAADAMVGRSGVIQVRTGACDVVAGQLVVRGSETRLAPGRYAFAEVTDAGVGMDAATRDRMFDPFFTTKFTGRGLGLAAVQGIVRGHGGSITVRSTPDVGTTVCVYLPSAAGGAAAEAVSPAPKASGLRATVMVVDDEDGVRRVVTRILESGGHTVQPYRSGAEAIAGLPGSTPRPRVAFVDLLMPGLDGPETARRLRAIDPHLALVVMSGFSEQEAAARFGALGPAAVLRKPFTAAELIAALDAVLQSLPDVGAPR